VVVVVVTVNTLNTGAQKTERACVTFGQNTHGFPLSVKPA
jgi:hypothetical protein